MKITPMSTLSDVLNNPVGYDIAQKVVYRKNIAADILSDAAFCQKTLGELLGGKVTDESTLAYGDFRPLETNDETYCFYRESGEGKFYIEMNLTENEIDRPKYAEGECVLSNYSLSSDKLRAYEANIYRMKSAE